MKLCSFIYTISQNVVNEINEDCYLLFYDYYATPINIFPLQSLIVFPRPNADKVRLVLVSSLRTGAGGRHRHRPQARAVSCQIRRGRAGAENCSIGHKPCRPEILLQFLLNCAAG